MGEALLLAFFARNIHFLKWLMVRIFCFLLIVMPFFTDAQRVDLDIFGGISNYQGDLQPLVFTLKNANPGAAIIAKYGITEKLFLRGGFSFGSISADDSKNKPSLKPRNLTFWSGIQEFHAGLEYRLFKVGTFPLTPYFFAGAGVFAFDPYAYDNNGTKVRLQPLGTEGQGLPEYPDRKPYSLTQVCIPYGVGIKWQVNCNLYIGAEFRQTKTFTDYLDDVSAGYADETALLNGRGQTTVDFAWRGGFNGRPYPAEGTIRGNPKEGDWYYFLGLTVGLKIHDCETGKFSLGGIFNNTPVGSKRGLRRQVGCPRL